MLFSKMIISSIMFKLENEEIVKDKHGNKLFYYIGLLSGGDCLGNCLKIIIKNNQKNEPLDENALKKMIDFEQSSSF